MSYVPIPGTWAAAEAVGVRAGAATVGFSTAIPLALVFLMLAAAVEAAESDKNEGTNYVDSPVAKACIALGPPDSATPLHLGSYQGMAHAIRGPIKHNTKLGIGKASLAPLAKPATVEDQVKEVVERIIESVQETVRSRGMDIDSSAVGRGIKRFRQQTLPEFYRRIRRNIEREYRQVGPRIREAVQDWLEEQMHHHLHGHHQMLDI